MTGASTGQNSKSSPPAAAAVGAASAPGVWQMSAGQRLKFWLVPLWMRMA